MSSFLLGIFLPSLLCFFQWSNCWQESQGLMQPSYFVHEHCLQRYRFPRSALFSKAVGTHCQNSKIHFVRSQPLDAVVSNHLSQKNMGIYIYVCVFLIFMVVMSKASFSDLSNVFISHVINTFHSTARSGCDFLANIFLY